MSNCPKVIRTELKAGEPLQIDFVAYMGDTVDPTIAGWTARIELKVRKTVEELIGVWVDGDPEIVRDDAAGLISLTVFTPETITWPFQKAYLDLLLTSPDGLQADRTDTIEITLNTGVTQYAVTA